MSTPKPASSGVSLSALNAQKAGEVPFWFTLVDDDDRECGSWQPAQDGGPEVWVPIELAVLGGQSETVHNEANRLINEQRKAMAVKAHEAAAGAKTSQVEFKPVEEDQAFVQRLAGVRLVGWRGIIEPFSKEAALELCAVNADVSGQVLLHSNKMANFMKVSFKRS